MSSPSAQSHQKVSGQIFVFIIWLYTYAHFTLMLFQTVFQDEKWITVTLKTKLYEVTNEEANKQWIRCLLCVMKTLLMENSWTRELWLCIFTYLFLFRAWQGQHVLSDQNKDTTVICRDVPGGQMKKASYSRNSNFRQKNRTWGGNTAKRWEVVRTVCDLFLFLLTW